MPDGEIVLCDRYNNKLKLLDSSDVLKDSMNLKTMPWDISFVDAHTVILTLPYAKQLKYIEVIPKLKAGRVLQLDKQCLGVHVNRDKVFTTCNNILGGEGEVRILDLNGNLQRRLGVNQDGSFMFSWPLYITASPTEEKIIVSDSFRNTITCMAMDNHIIYQYKDDEMRSPRGLYCDDGDNILVCGQVSDNVKVITAEERKCCELLSSSDGLKKPCSISYREKDEVLIVGCIDSDHMFMFTLGK